MLILAHISMLLLSVFFLSPSVHAQDFQPVVVSSSASAFKELQGLYILGGYTADKSVNSQTFMLDLSQSWDAVNPIVQKLPDGPLSWDMPSTLTADGQGWFALVNGTGYLYDIKNSTWSTVLHNNSKINSEMGLKAITDPETGMIYVPNGHIEKNQMSMLTVNLNTTKIGSVPMPSGFNTSSLYSAAWSASRKSMVFISESADSLYSYSTTDGWTHLNVTGDIPSPRVSSCLLPMNDDSKIVLFGGYSRTEHRSLNDIYVLDLASLVWTRGPNVDEANGRDSAACAISNDFFIVWGGISSNSTQDAAPSKVTIVYNLERSVWVSRYNTPAPIDANSHSRMLYQIGTVLGGVFGGIMFLGIIAYAIYHRRVPKPVQIYQNHYPASFDDYQTTYSYGYADSKTTLV
ncbi:hypothetical protein BX616_002111 [Lobosporangium transversale]|uniref:Galactose oxidase n=1 Tax=Lobosporangium transversale TaxID=64571 RepID=A0A1Y2H3B5_9FUNG|nr:hypothetical protein BCR41DRAFT_366709 [Lobosporangium transversale]KAF9901846.1 hypothetical protein BX616_002111 [Lobosporangium transversale]ORZ29048.1 hypothetical protein BCR41DRAFT_366709 [Lobosporangium transversale]|eukprot:XP_021886721.1 hypothetical protein BCR41DRAFT_366709 [Lobosporangium transversale]